jgi:hypothetical protein
MDKQYITIIDNTGRNVLGTLASETSTELEILNPVMITVQPQNGQFQVQLIPLFLAEFIAQDATTLRNFTYTYNKANVAVGKNFNIDARITSQYDRIIETTNAVKPAVAAKESTPEVIKLFE